MPGNNYYTSIKAEYKMKKIEVGDMQFLIWNTIRICFFLINKDRHLDKILCLMHYVLLLVFSQIYDKTGGGI